MTRSDITNIVEQYERHSWKLRKITLDDGNLLAELVAAYPGTSASRSVNEGLWFSRRSRPGEETWELRRVSGSPFALVAVVPDELSELERLSMLSEVESRMFNTSAVEPTSH